MMILNMASLSFKIVKTKEQVGWKWMKKFTEESLKDCALAEDGKVSIDFEIASPFKLFNKCIGLQGLLSMLKVESESRNLSKQFCCLVDGTKNSIF